MKARIILSILLTVAMAATSSAQQKLELPKVIGSNMVLQQGEAVRIWGQGIPGRKVRVSFDGQRKTAVVDADGSWSLSLDPMQADFTPKVMTVSDGKQRIRLENILVGEVWLAGGQSNMEYRMDRPKGYVLQKRGEDVQMEEYLKGGDERIRLLYVEKRRNVDTLPSKGWRTLSRESLGDMSAPAYFFAQTLADSLNVPVGVMSISWGGSAIEAWTPRDRALDFLRSHPDSRNNSIRESEYGSMFASMIAPVIPYTVKGFIWYQGESNLINHPDNFHYYYDKQKLLVESWRELWGDESLPFYYVQLAPYTYSQRRDRYPATWDMLPQFWAIQQRLMDIPYSGMAPVLDLVDEPGDIHPPYKHVVGYRLALWALNKDYGRSYLETSGPVFKSARIEGDEIVLQFSHADGLRSSDGKPLSWFQILNSRGNFVRTTVEIRGNEVRIPAQKGLVNQELRFAWDELAMPNLVNSAGLPALPFRTTVTKQ